MQGLAENIGGSLLGNIVPSPSSSFASIHLLSPSEAAKIRLISLMAGPNPKSDFHVLVIGAGSVGLLIAQRLKTLGVTCTVFEREHFLNERSRDWSFGIYWAQEWLTECLPGSLLGKLNTAQVDPLRTPGPDDYMRLMNGRTGEDLTLVPAPNLYRLMRSRFRGLLAEGIDVKVLYTPTSLLRLDGRLRLLLYLPMFYCSMARDSAAYLKTRTEKTRRSQQPLRTAPKLQATSWSAPMVRNP